MKLLRLKLENFRQHRNTEIVFRDGMTAIVGSNGTGKSTLLEAITFALYGIQRKTRESLKFYWADKGAKVRVTVEFEFDGRTYRLVRTLTDAELVDITSDPSVVRAHGIREVKSSCERLLRLTYDQFKNSFCAEQKSLAFLQFNNDTRRQEQVAKMLGFDRLKLAADLAKERGREFKAMAAALAETMGSLPDLRSQRDLARDELKKAKETKKQVDELRDRLNQGLPDARARRDLAKEFEALGHEAHRYASTAEALKGARKRAEEALEKAKADLKKRDELAPVSREFLGLEASVREMQAYRELEIEREKKQAELTRLEGELGELEKKRSALSEADLAGARKGASAAIAAASTASSALRAAEAAWSKEKQAAQGDASAADAEFRQAEAAASKAGLLVEQGICPECGQPTTAGMEKRLGELKALEAEAARTLETARARLKAAEAKPKSIFDAEAVLEAAQKADVEARDRLAAAEIASTERNALTAQLEAVKGRASSLKADLGEMPRRYDRDAHLKAESLLKSLRPGHEDFLKLANAADAAAAAERGLAHAKAEIEDAHGKYLALVEQQKKLPFKNGQEAAEAITAFEDLRRKVAECEAELKASVGLINGASNKLSMTESNIEKFHETERNASEKRSQAIHHEAADKELKALREDLNRVIRPDLESRAADNLALLTNGRYPLLELDEEFNGTVIEDGVRKQVISGGEEDVVALALRMALSELIQERQGRPMSLLILDEVFGSLDSDRRQAVLERLQAIKGRFAQILVISHIEEINQVADQTIFLSRDERSRSTVVGDLPVIQPELIPA